MADATRPADERGSAGVGNPVGAQRLEERRQALQNVEDKKSQRYREELKAYTAAVQEHLIGRADLLSKQASALFPGVQMSGATIRIVKAEEVPKDADPQLRATQMGGNMIAVNPALYLNSPIQEWDLTIGHEIGHYAINQLLQSRTGDNPGYKLSGVPRDLHEGFAEMIGHHLADAVELGQAAPNSRELARELLAEAEAGTARRLDMTEKAKGQSSEEIYEVWRNNREFAEYYPYSYLAVAKLLIEKPNARLDDIIAESFARPAETPGIRDFISGPKVEQREKEMMAEMVRIHMKAMGTEQQAGRKLTDDELQDAYHEALDRYENLLAHNQREFEQLRKDIKAVEMELEGGGTAATKGSRTRSVPIDEIFDVEIGGRTAGAAKRREKLQQEYERRAADLTNELKTWLNGRNVNEVSEEELFTEMAKTMKNKYRASYAPNELVSTSISNNTMNCYSSSVLFLDALEQLGKTGVQVVKVPGHVFLAGNKFCIETAPVNMDDVVVRPGAGGSDWVVWEREKLGTTKHLANHVGGPEALLESAYNNTGVGLRNKFQSRSRDEAEREKEGLPPLHDATEIAALKDKAIAYFEKAIEVDPKGAANAEQNLGGLYAFTHDYDNARLHYGRAIQLNPDNGDALNAMGAVLERQGKREEADAMFMRAVEASANKQHDLVGALMAIQNAIITNPNEPFRFNIKGQVLTAMGRPEEAASAFDDAANAYGRKNEFSQALENADKAIGLDPNNSDVWAAKGGILKAMGRGEEARVCFEKANDLS